ncbi:hypothetical protein BDV37DRAFT_287158 [Aspergillus pseudonomiae]|uniref:Uncharacterized protein n=1 Tax=Aspergillus pseudonomiae TaxID=1506151 RepID=A0A5N7D092_9EURO|nr:uncharacterized protein BDV37DRAFT_287158 [Aspergillus pseudonomiae]KAE8399841.1 hypothetical protein BDV37DRAFT_287158 [Aspergillus pseudonomiae]
MSDPYAQHPHHAPPGPGPEANFYAPADSLYQNPPYDYESQHPHAQQFPPDQNYQHGSQYDLAQTPRSYPPQMSGPQQDYLNPASAEGFEQERNRRGSNADYYNAPTDERDRDYPPSSHPQEANNTSDNEGTERNLAGALAGGAGGYYLGHQSNHGLLGAMMMSTIITTTTITMDIIITVTNIIMVIAIIVIMVIIAVILGTVAIAAATDWIPSWIIFSSIA